MKLARINWETRELVISGPYEYPVDLDRANSSSQLLDWILQINSKTWCTPAIIKDMLDVLEDGCERTFKTNLQGAYCPGECGTKRSRGGNYVNWKTKEIYRPEN